MEGCRVTPAAFSYVDFNDSGIIQSEGFLEDDREQSGQISFPTAFPLSGSFAFF